MLPSDICCPLSEACIRVCSFIDMGMCRDRVAGIGENALPSPLLAITCRWLQLLDTSLPAPPAVSLNLQSSHPQ